MSPTGTAGGRDAEAMAQAPPAGSPGGLGSGESEETCAPLRVPGRPRPLRLCGGPGETEFLEEIRERRGKYEFRLGLLLGRILGPRACVIDVGAHIGAMALTAGALAPAGRVHAFEPVPASAARLRANVARNGLRNVTVHEMAVLDADRPVRIRSMAFSAGSFVPVGEDGEAGGEEVAGVSLDSWVAGAGLAGVDAIKVDAEGSELRVLDGAAQTLRRFRPWLIVECNPAALRRFHGRDEGDLHDALREHCERVFWVAEGGSLQALPTVRALRERLGRDGVGNLLAGPRRPRGTWYSAAGVGLGLAKRVRGASWRPGAPALRYVIDPRVRLSDAALDAPDPLVPGATYRGSVRVANEGLVRLTSRYHTCPIHLAARWRDERGAPVGENARTPLDPGIPPGGSALLTFEVAVPHAPGRYRLCVTLVQERYSWFDDLDPAAAAVLPVTVG